MGYGVDTIRSGVFLLKDRRIMESMESKGVDRGIDIISGRYRKVLRAIMKEYIRTAAPVSSKAVSAGYSPGLSSATIRSIMADLEGDGFLLKRHASAGRVPTEKCFRFYVDSLLETEGPVDAEKELIKRCLDRIRDTNNLLTETARALSTLTRCAGLALVPGIDSLVIKHIRLLPMGSARLMLLVVSSLGHVKTRVVDVGAIKESFDLDEISDYLSSVGEGLTLKSLRAKILKDMSSEKRLYGELLSRAFNLSSASPYSDPSDISSGEAFYLEGQANIFDQPEFRDDFERMRRLFAAFEQKSLLVKILDDSMGAGGVNIRMGSESSIDEFDGLSFVTAPYSRCGTVVGMLGVIGPVRMDYSKIVPLVSYTADLLSEAL